MRQVIVAGYGGTDQLRIRETPDPAPGVGQVRIRVRAAGVNFADVLARQGLYPDAPKPPCVVGYEVSGVVDAAGPHAGADWVGREVFAMTRFGGYPIPWSSLRARYSASRPRCPMSRQQPSR